ncbi:JAB-like toxin 1 domain-containing protein [Chryseobacterium sp. FH2]|uniref:JAB-like toxin 1 domain-containing protein n=1 Tax=Chryseobacterium sp. FH2 TaxID=1674291 RepID=UPI00397744D0
MDFGTNEEKALEYFKYGASNTDVEFSVKTESGNSISGTSHRTNSVTTPIYDRKMVTLFGHSHHRQKLPL